MMRDLLWRALISFSYAVCVVSFWANGHPVLAVASFVVFFLASAKNK